MKEFNFTRERMASLRKKNKAFHRNMIDKLQGISGKYSNREQEANAGPDYAHPRATGEDGDEEIIKKSPFLGHLRGEDKWITLPDYETTPSMGARVLSCTLLYENFDMGT